MNCEQMESSLLAVIDGRATAEERERVEGHVAACAHCARRMEEMRAMWSALDALPAVEPSAWFDARLRARIKEPQPKSGGLGRLRRSVRWLAVVAALVLVAVWIAVRPSTQQPARVTTTAAETQSQDDFSIVKNLPELENYDVISSFDALSALPGAQTVNGPQQVE